METLFNDVTYGFRLLFKHPGFTVIVILALALGIGANTAVFSVINAVLLKPLPYPQPDQIVSIAGRFTGIGIPDDRNQFSPPEFMDLRRLASAFSDISVVQGASYNIRVGQTPERIGGAVVSANFFRLIGTSPQLGRAFAPEEEQPGRDTAAILGHGLWQEKFGADPGVLGRPIEINGRTYTIVGVMPPGFDYPFQSVIWTPQAFTNTQLSPNFRGNHFLLGLARIKPDLTFAQALTDMDRVSQQIIEGAPNYPYKNFNFHILIRPILEDFVGDIRPALGLLMGAVALVLLIACANAANLFMVRASAREREIGIRIALGASRRRLIRQLLTESVLLSVAGAAFGVALAKIGVSAIAGIGGQAFPRLAQAEMDWMTLAFTTSVALTTGIFFGIVPALQVSQSATHESLKEGGRSLTAGMGHQRLRRIFVIAEVALSLALLAGAGLLIKSVMRLQDVDPGFQPEGGPDAAGGTASGPLQPTGTGAQLFPRIDGPRLPNTRRRVSRSSQRIAAERPRRIGNDYPRDGGGAAGAGFTRGGLAGGDPGVFSNLEDAVDPHMLHRLSKILVSIAARLLNRARQSGDDYQTLLTSFCLERSCIVSAHPMPVLDDLWRGANRKGIRAPGGP